MRTLTLLLATALVLTAATVGVSGASLGPATPSSSLGSGVAHAVPAQAGPTATSAKRRRKCDPNYRGRCLRRNVRDYDCAGGSGDGPRYVRGPFRVVGRDRFGLDSDGDGIACES